MNKQLEKEESDLLFNAVIVEKNIAEKALEIIKKYETVNIVDRSGRTLLMWGVLQGDLEFVDYLIQNKVELDVRDKIGMTAIHFAAQEGQLEIIKTLLNAGAKIDPQDIHGRSPLSLAVFNSKGKGEIITLLLKAGANPNIKNNSGVTPFELAKSIGNFDVVKYFEGFVD